MNIIACMSSNGIHLWKIVEKVSWLTFNEFLEEASRLAAESHPSSTAIFVFDNAPAHKRAQAATLHHDHSVRHLPPYSPFFNPIEEMFSKFKYSVKQMLSERHSEVMNTPQHETKKSHRRKLLIDKAMRTIQASNCAAYDRKHFQVHHCCEGNAGYVSLFFDTPLLC